jgi:hypothetical protein
MMMHKQFEFEEGQMFRVFFVLVPLFATLIFQSCYPRYLIEEGRPNDATVKMFTDGSEVKRGVTIEQALVQYGYPSNYDYLASSKSVLFYYYDKKTTIRDYSDSTSDKPGDGWDKKTWIEYYVYVLRFQLNKDVPFRSKLVESTMHMHLGIPNLNQGQVSVGKFLSGLAIK